MAIDRPDHMEEVTDFFRFFQVDDAAASAGRHLGIEVKVLVHDLLQILAVVGIGTIDFQVVAAGFRIVDTAAGQKGTPQVGH